MMNFRKYAAAMALTAVFALQTAFAAHAVTAPHLYFGTERAYGEESLQIGELYQGTHSFTEDGGDGYANLGAQYAILPKTDAILFEKADSPVDPDIHLAYLCWVVIPREPDNTRPPGEYNGYTVLDDGKIAVSLGATQYTLDAAHMELLEYGKPYPVFPDELRQYPDEEPLVWLLVRVPEMDSQWSVLYIATDNWQAPGSSLSYMNGTQSGVWWSDLTGWWIHCDDGSYLTNTWYQDPRNGLWYYLGEDGYMLTDTWFQSPDSGLWYYLAGDGHMLTDAATPDNHYVNADGIRIR